ncbi:origin recognition complex subunit 1 [Schistocerca nitens]|uniref:origin recognition complex subunit 1 n=1 Tax=Schistocerca nitens TaxID=7011 RepID=UPI002117CF38|nr:origin recognition complex subunit 1 [Schistocerca nitens]XP_049810410.1 origin recognition complex subunit 1 [Schistocerca nitens]
MQNSMSPVLSGTKYKLLNSPHSNQRRHSHLKNDSSVKYSENMERTRDRRKCKTRLFDESLDKLKPEEISKLINREDDVSSEKSSLDRNQIDSSCSNVNETLSPSRKNTPRSCKKRKCICCIPEGGTPYKAEIEERTVSEHNNSSVLEVTGAMFYSSPTKINVRMNERSPSIKYNYHNGDSSKSVSSPVNMKSKRVKNNIELKKWKYTEDSNENEEVKVQKDFQESSCAELKDMRISQKISDGSPKSSSKSQRLKKRRTTTHRDPSSDIENSDNIGEAMKENITVGKKPPKKRRQSTHVQENLVCSDVSSPSCTLKLAMSRLHVSSVPRRLPCRETEFDNIYRFVKSRLSDGVGGCMYISGVPGTGKTATVRSVMRELQMEAQRSKLTNFKFIEINGLQLTEPRQAYVRILKELGGEKVTTQTAQEILEKKFTKPSKKDLPTVLLVDELDMLCTRRQDVIYNMLEWPSVTGCRLIVITIANTMDLPERLLMGRVTSRLGLTRLTFQPYTYKQLEEIVKARLFGVDAFDADAVQFVARKVASVSGDARRALNICRRATEIAESDILLTTCTNSPRKNSSMVTMKHIDKALQEMFSSPVVQIIKNLSVMEQLLLKSVAAVVQDTGIEKCTFKKVYTYLRTLSTFDGISVPSSTKTLSIIAKLGCYGLLLTEHSRADIFQSVMLNINSDDLHFALQTNS